MNTWPYPGDAPLLRARRVAHAYRQKLAEVDPDACDELDHRIRLWGQHWAVPRAVAHQPDDLLPPAEAADLANVSVKSIGQMRRRGRLVGRKVNGQWLYRAGDIIALSTAPRRRHHTGPT